ncbi:MAG: transcriptional regulator, TetR family [Solirubrobacterales bacterium]|jgi:AcrR family transcriptional regulator|nr:transcriptional regulator, TetR family [Solirubrobacterales bacterium]
MPRTLSTADARREALLEAALPLFAERGLTGTPTLAVAKASGISQAYLFRLFPTKADLAIALVERMNDRMYEAMAGAGQAAKAAGEEVIPAMGEAYVRLLQEDRDLLLLNLHAYAACPQFPALRDTMRAGFARMQEMVAELSGADPLELRRFFAQGMLLNVVAALDIWELEEPWAQTLLGPDDGPGC